jgi:ribosomal-protein-alanine N-acetyltransferase
MKAGWVWRELTRDDVLPICEMEAVSCLHPVHAWSEANYLSSLSSGYWMRVLCSPDGQLAGWCVCMIGIDELHLLNIAVASPWHRQGLASTMLDELLSLCRDRQLEAIWLEVRPSNQRAQALYQAKGYQHISVRKNYYPAPEGREDALVMKLEVPRDPLA